MMNTKINIPEFKRKAKYYLSPLFIKALILWFIFVISILQTGATAVTTNAATGVSSNSVTMNGNLVLTVNPTIVWFEYGRQPGIYFAKSANQSMAAGGAFASTVTGLPLQGRQTYFFRAVADDGTASFTGAELTFITNPVTQISNYTFDRYTGQLVSLKLNITGTAELLPKPYTDIMGSIFWGIFFGFIFVMIWLRSEDVTIPALLGLLIGASLWGFMPPEWVQFAYSLTIVSFAGLVYSLIKARG